MNEKKQLVTISDIAKAVGVSNATVSRALNNKETVSDDILMQVRKAAQELGYSPQRVHKKNQEKKFIAVLTDSRINTFYSEVLSALQHHALEYGYVSQIIQMPDDKDSQTRILRQIKALPWLGIISVGFLMESEEWIHLQEVMEVPVVLFNISINHNNIACLKVNFKAANTTALQYLIDMGHKRIAYLGDLNDHFMRIQMQNVEDALEKQGLHYHDEYRISISHTLEGASQAISRIMMLSPKARPTAIMAFDDDFAIQLLNALNYYHISVPEDISLIGFDNMPMSAHTHPPLTTVDVPKYRIGLLLVKLLQQLIDRKADEPVGHIFVDTSLVVRKSITKII